MSTYEDRLSYVKALPIMQRYDVWSVEVLESLRYMVVNGQDRVLHQYTKFGYDTSKRLLR